MTAAAGAAPDAEAGADPGPALPVAPPVLEGPRLRLRPTVASDVAALAAILDEPGVARWWPRFDAARVTAELVAPGDAHVWAIEVAPGVLSARPKPAVVAERRVVGAIQAWEEADPDFRHAGIDVFLAGAAQGRGLGTEAIRLVAAWLVDVRGHHRLTIDPAAANAVAIRAYAKAGFAPVGTMRAYQRGPDGAWEDGLLMEVLAADLVRA